MKLTVSAGKQSVTVEFEEAECRARFKDIADALLEAEPAPAPYVPVTETLPAMCGRTIPPPYKGFLYIRCPSCGAVKGFNSKVDMYRYHCHECDQWSDLNDMVFLYVNCECGVFYHYRTNMIDPVFELDCLECGSPVAVTLNVPEGVYETIGRSGAWKKGREQSDGH